MSKQADDATKTDRWRAVVARDSAAAGSFVYAVTTTDIYCRPGCPSRRPNRGNVRFFDGPRAAEVAGFRPCKRCAPQLEGKADPAAEAAVDAVAEACRLIRSADSEPSLEEIAAAVDLSPYHFHRLFKSTLGITPKQYAAEQRLARVRDAVRSEPTITGAIYEAGFASSGRFYEVVPAALGMMPTAYRDGAPGLTLRFAIARADLGWVLVAATDKGICRIDLDDDPQALLDRLTATFPAAHLIGDDVTFRETVAQVVAMIERPARSLDLPLDIQGTAFQRRVWAALQEIPLGETLSYGEVAARIGRPQAARAVAGACAANKIAVAIPCHRVVRSDGTLGGYRWGLERKAALLDREAEA